MNAISYIHLSSGGTPPTLSLPPFKAIIVAEDTTIGDWRDEVSEWLVRSGCLYFCAWGDACEAWHDSVDNANISELQGHTIPEDRLVMTTWHAKEPLSEALWFVGICAEHPTVELGHTIIVHVAQGGATSFWSSTDLRRTKNSIVGHRVTFGSSGL